MNLIILGVNHKTAPVEIREKLAFSEKHFEETFNALHDYPELKKRLYSPPATG